MQTAEFKKQETPDELAHQVTYLDLTRQERLEIWMRRKGLTYTKIGQQLGVAKWAASRMLQAETMPPHHHKRLAGHVIPLDLLPEPVYQKPGPKPKPQGEAA